MGPRGAKLVRRAEGENAEQVRGLQFIADRLNRIGRLNPTLQAAWEGAAEIILKSLRGSRPAAEAPSRGRLFLDRAALRFNRWAQGFPVALCVRRRQTWQADAAPREPRAFAAWYLWRYFFDRDGWQRLKQCPTCRRWFVDETRNRKKQRCSDSCTARWWNRRRRRAAGHRAGLRSRPRGRAAVYGR